MVHKELKDYKCVWYLSDKVFSTLKSLKQHINSFHKGQNNYKCDICEKLFSLPGRLKKHVNSVHEGFKHKCDICDNAIAHQKSSKTYYGISNSSKSF